MLQQSIELIVEPFVTTYLEMRPGDGAFKRQNCDQKFRVREFKEPNWIFNRDMYIAVGETWKWIDKRPWTNERWNKYASAPNLRTFAAYYDNALAGYYELRRSDRPSTPSDGEEREDEVEIAYCGFLPAFIGRGLGGALLTSAIENALACAPPPSRVWVHTGNRDHPNALNNYQAKGFKIYKTEEGGAD
ncbi:MAG: GNAT family N-acetyltransferase [Verrucomicrobia bacterium]|nr:MAG: GNAT family N-acetyltransferase [Verrucomicrobiota bacterium]